ncbi:hypothetical protein [Streptomyces sp. DG1A-41]|uniref:hypothetical protein n=1 Tax=Streptomyces sp. DG1A-41 TaxID=3125779 RepID=UPI0030CE7BE1
MVTATGSGRFEADDEVRALETLVMLRVEALVVCSGLLPSERILPFAARLPTVVAGRPETHPSITSVCCDEDGGGTALADHLAELGHREVAVITVPTSSGFLTGAGSSAGGEGEGADGQQAGGTCPSPATTESATWRRP